MKKGLIFAVLLAAGLAFGYWKWQQSQQALPTGIAAVNGRLSVERIDVASLYAGRVTAVFGQEGDWVELDQPLAQITSPQLEHQLAVANSQFAAAEAQQAQIAAEKQRATQAVSRAKAEVVAKQQQAAVAKLELNNAQKLRKDNLVSVSEVERRQANYQAAQAAVQTASAAQREAESAVAQSEAAFDQAQAMLDKAAVDRQIASAQQAEMVVKAPISGRLEYRIAEVGNVLATGGRVASLLDLDDVYLNVFLPTVQANQVRLGDEARIVLDGVNEIFPATVSYVASEAQFTPKSVETAEERTKLMFKIKLQLPKAVVQAQPNLFKGGMPAMAYVKYDPQAQWTPALQRKAIQTGE